MIYLADRAYITVDMLDMEIIEKYFTIQLFEDSKCGNCEFVQDKPSDPCYGGCPNFLGNLKLWQQVEFKGKNCIALPIGNLPRITKLLGIDFSKAVDLRPAPKMSKPIKWTGTLYEGQVVKKVVTANQKLLTDQWLKKKYGILQASPRSGKTFMSANITCALGLRTLIIAHQSDLLRQFKKAFLETTNIDPKKIGIVKKLEEIEKYDVALLTYQKFIREDGLAKSKKFLNNFGLLVVDECFPAETPILVDHNKAVSIKEIYENDQITHILSYDLKNKKIEKRRILRKIKVPYTKRDGITIHIGNTSLSMTANHPVYVKRKGWIEAKNLKVGDQIIVHNENSCGWVKFCEVCGQEFSGNTNIGPHKLSHNIDKGDHSGTCNYCNQHYESITNIETFEFRGGEKSPNVYNLEVEKNHNYFALSTMSGNLRSRGKLKIKLEDAHKPILVSNCHSIGADCFSKFVNRLNIKHKMGLTATPLRKDGRSKVISTIIGPVTSKTTTTGLIPEVIPWYTGIDKKGREFKSWPYAMRYLATHKERNKMIVRQVFQDLRQGHVIILPVGTIEHLNTLVEMINKQAAVNNKKRNEDWPDLCAIGLHGKSPRESILAAVDNGEHKVLVATRGLIKQGITLLPTSALYVLVPMSASSTQVAGEIIGAPMFYQLGNRITTPYIGKPNPIVRILIDDLSLSVGCYKSLFRNEVFPNLKAKEGNQPRYKMSHENAQISWSIFRSGRPDNAQESDFSYEMNSFGIPKIKMSRRKTF